MRQFLHLIFHLLDDCRDLLSELRNLKHMLHQVRGVQDNVEQEGVGAAHGKKHRGATDCQGNGELTPPGPAAQIRRGWLRIQS